MERSDTIGHNSEVIVRIDEVRVPPDTRSSKNWVGLGEASRLLGIAPGTLRRWADAGRVPVFTTPGGHRRFSRSTINALLPAARTRRPALARLGASPERMARAYHVRRRTGAAGAPATGRPWIAALTDEARDTFRTRGRELVALLLEHLDAPDADRAAETLQAASQLAAAYGRESAAQGASLSEAVERFLWFRSPFVVELGALARKRGLDTREATALLADAEAATDRLLVSMMTGHTIMTGLRQGPA
jgi:excisionase family DNA binding protein